MAEMAATRKQATMYVNPRVLDLKRSGAEKLPMYPSSDRTAADKVVDNVFFIGNGMVGAKKVDGPRVPEVAHIPEVLVDAKLDGNINGLHNRKWAFRRRMCCITTRSSQNIYTLDAKWWVSIPR